MNVGRKADQGATTAASGESEAQKEIRVLIADDHPVVRQGMKAMLHGRGVQVVGEARNGKEAVELAMGIKPDVVLMDIRMPDVDGIDATRIIREELSATAVIIMTSFETADYLRRALDAGASGYLLKGVSRDVLVQAVRLTVEGESMIDARMLADLKQQPETADDDGASVDHLIERLTPRELDVLKLLAHGLTNKQIAQEMHYSVGTVKNVVQRIIEKLQVTDRTQAAVYAVRAGVDVE